MPLPGRNFPTRTYANKALRGRGATSLGVAGPLEKQAGRHRTSEWLPTVYHVRIAAMRLRGSSAMALLPSRYVSASGANGTAAAWSRIPLASALRAAAEGQASLGLRKVPVNPPSTPWNRGRLWQHWPTGWVNRSAGPVEPQCPAQVLRPEHRSSSRSRLHAACSC